MLPIEVTEILKELEAKIANLQQNALAEARIIYNKPEMSVLSFHAHIGGRNVELGQVIHKNYVNPEEYFATWVCNVLNKVDTLDKEKKYRKYQSKYHLLKLLLSNKITREYLQLFFERNFYRQWIARTRLKPAPNLWSIWFGENGFAYGLLITPMSDFTRTDHPNFTGLTTPIS